jgi:sugar lactone lactonase YvrE
VSRRLASVLAAVAVLAGTAVAAEAEETRGRWDTRVFSLVPSPGYPANVYVHPNGRVYASTYSNPRGDSEPSRVFEWSADGTLQRSWTVPGQDLSAEHGVQVAISDASGRLVLLEKSTARALLLDPRSGAFTEYASFGEGAVPNFAAWGPDGSLYVTDYAKAVVWRVPPGGGNPRVWLDVPALKGGPLATTGIALAADRKTLLITQQTGLGSLDLTGALFAVPIRSDETPGTLRTVWRSRPMDLPDGFAIARSGRIYVSLLGPSQLAVIAPDGSELERFPELPLTGDNGSPAPFDSPSGVAFLGTRVLVANQSYLTGNPDHQTILDVETGEPGLPPHIPPT